MSKSVSEAEIATLKALAEAATKGPWVATGGGTSRNYVQQAADCSCFIAQIARTGMADNRYANAAFIAALNPATVLRILADREARLREAAKALEDMMQWAAALAYGKSKADHKDVLASPRYEKARVTLAFLSPGKPSKAKETAT